MSDPSYPIQCQSCSKPQYGPVKFCPYCGFQTPVAPVAEEVPEKVEPGQVTEESAGIFTSPEHVSQEPILEPEPIMEQNTTLKPEQVPPTTVETVSETSEDKQKMASDDSGSETPKDVPTPLPKPDPVPKRDYLKWILVAVVFAVVAIAGYLIYKPVITKPPTDHGKENARILELDALRNGTDLSVTISKIPKLEKVLEAARRLGEISPRYQSQITLAKATLSAARNERDKNLLSYLGKVSELGRYTPEQISYAMGVIKNGDLTSREKKVAELLTEHVNSINKKKKADPKKILLDFNRSFNDFVE
ncbi:MAG: hypothetical protein WBN77_11630 [Desulfobacterales bacterium]